MAKYHGKIGFVTIKEQPLGVDIEEATEREYFGDVQKRSRKWETGESVNDNLNVNVQISIVADSYLRENCFAVRYICWMGARWKVTSVEPTYPRLTLTIGGVYNGPTPETAPGTPDSDGSGEDGEVPARPER